MITFEFVKDETFAKGLEEWEELSPLKDREYIQLHRENSKDSVTEKDGVR